MNAPVAVTLTAAEADTLRFVLGIIDVDDLENPGDRKRFLSILEKIEAAS